MSALLNDVEVALNQESGPSDVFGNVSGANDASNRVVIQKVARMWLLPILPWVRSTPLMLFLNLTMRICSKQCTCRG
jgi:hypothetical protein